MSSFSSCSPPWSRQRNRLALLAAQIRGQLAPADYRRLLCLQQIHFGPGRREDLWPEWLAELDRRLDQFQVRLERGEPLRCLLQGLLHWFRHRPLPGDLVPCLGGRGEVRDGPGPVTLRR